VLGIKVTSMLPLSQIYFEQNPTRARRERRAGICSLSLGVATLIANVHWFNVPLLAIGVAAMLTGMVLIEIAELRGYDSAAQRTRMIGLRGFLFFLVVIISRNALRITRSRFKRP
jgi:hypothetical protein